MLIKWLYEMHGATIKKLVCVWALECHSQWIWQNKDIQVQHANQSTDCPHWCNYNIKILEYTKLRSITIYSDVLLNLCDSEHLKVQAHSNLYFVCTIWVMWSQRDLIQMGHVKCIYYTTWHSRLHMLYLL